MPSPSYRGYTDKEAHELLTQVKLVFQEATDKEMYLFLEQVCKRVLDLSYLPAFADPRYTPNRPAIARQLHEMLKEKAHGAAYARNRQYQDKEMDNIYGGYVQQCVELAKALPEFSLALAIHNLRHAGG
jgi:hypothetical protein